MAAVRARRHGPVRDLARILYRKHVADVLEPGPVTGHIVMLAEVLQERDAAWLEGPVGVHSPGEELGVKHPRPARRVEAFQGGHRRGRRAGLVHGHVARACHLLQSDEKLGFELEGTMRRCICKRGVWLDQWMIAITRPDWEALQSHCSDAGMCIGGSSLLTAIVICRGHIPRQMPLVGATPIC